MADHKPTAWELNGVDTAAYALAALCKCPSFSPIALSLASYPGGHFQHQVLSVLSQYHQRHKTSHVGLVSTNFNPRNTLDMLDVFSNPLFPA